MPVKIENYPLWLLQINVYRHAAIIGYHNMYTICTRTGMVMINARRHPVDIAEVRKLAQTNESRLLALLAIYKLRA